MFKKQNNNKRPLNWFYCKNNNYFKTLRNLSNDCTQESETI